MPRASLRPGEIGRIHTKQVRPGVWLASALYRDHLGTKGRSRKLGRSESAARRALLEEIEERLNLDAPLNGLATSKTRVSDAMNVYLTHRLEDARNSIGRAHPRSIKIYRSVAENWIVPVLGDLQVRHLTAGRLDAYFRRDVPPTRYSDVRKVLHGFLSWLIVQGALRTDPLANVQSYQRRDARRRSRDREVTSDDLTAVLNAIEAWMTANRPGPRPSTVYRDLVLFIAGTACRPGEALAVRRGDIDFEYPVAPGDLKPVVHITGTIVVDDKTGKLTRQPHTKGRGAGDRTVILPPFVAAMLRERLAAGAPNENDAVFSTKGGNWLSLNNINTRLRDSILKGTEVGQWFELRLLRSATGTVVANAYGAEAAAAQMGNTREIAETHYIHKSRLAPDHSGQIQAAWESALHS